MLHISSAFDGGNIDCLSCTSPDNIELAICPDNQSEFYQWFYFRLTGAQGEACRLRLTNAGAASYVEGFKGYSAVASYDRDHWFRVPTEFDGENLVICHRPEQNAIYYAYFVPYSMERHHDFVSWAAQSERVTLHNLGLTVDGQAMDLLHVQEVLGQEQKVPGQGSLGQEAPPRAGKKRVWIIARQHPGETMAEWWVEGFVSRLLDNSDPVVRELLRRADFFVVPNMNPDGSMRGNLRTNAVGRNLNREWQSPSRLDSPEVFYVRQKMIEVGLDFCLDVHGDEALPYNFLVGAEGSPSWDSVRQADLDFYKQTLMALNPDFQCAKGYPVAAPGSANLAICTNYVAETFGVLAMTLEMPFKDTLDCPDVALGWSPERCQRLGESNIDAIYRYFVHKAW